MIKFKYTDKIREDVWDKLCMCETMLTDLKSIVQNNGDLDENDLYQWKNNKQKLFDKLNLVQDDLNNNSKQ